MPGSMCQPLSYLHLFSILLSHLPMALKVGEALYSGIQALKNLAICPLLGIALGATGSCYSTIAPALNPSRIQHAFFFPHLGGLQGEQMMGGSPY